MSRRALERHLEVSPELVDEVIAELVEVKACVELDARGVLTWRKGSTTGSERAETAPAAKREAERRLLTIMFCDLVESSALSTKLDPEELREVVRHYQHACSTAVEPLGGYISEYLGDGVVIYFGYPRAFEDAPLRAAKAGLAVLDAVHATNASLRKAHGLEIAVRIGIHTGQVVIGEIGAQGSERTSALGEAPNLAARLQALAQPDEIVVSDVTERLVRGFFTLEDLGPRTLKGIARDQHVFRVLDATQARSRFDVALLGRLSRFVGRDAETARLEALWQETSRGGSAVALVVAEAGVGKSRLVNAFAQRLQQPGVLQMLCRCSSYHQATAYFPIVELLQLRLGFKSGQNAEQQLELLEHELLALDLCNTRVVTSIASILSLPVPPDRYPDPKLPPPRRKQENLEVLGEVLGAIARRSPVLLIMEDVHWIDPTSAEVLVQLRRPGVLMVLTSRPAPLTRAIESLAPTRIELERLSQDASSQLLDDMLGAIDVPHELRAQLLSKMDGVPLFIEEQTRALIESGLLQRTEVAAELARMPIAETLQDSIVARLDGLEPDARAVAQIAATYGRAFDHALLKAISPLDPARLRTALAQLVEAGLIQCMDPGEERFAFRHALVQDVTYASMLKSRRTTYHGLCARALISHPEIEKSQPELIAYHCRHGGDHALAVDYYERAAKTAAGHWALGEAIDLVEHALAALKHTGKGDHDRLRELDLLFALGPLLMSLRGYANSDVQRTYAQIRTLCETEVNRARLFPALAGVWQHCMVGGELRQAKALGEELVEIATEQDDAARRIVAMRALGTTLLLLGELEASIALSRTGWEMYDAKRHHGLAVTHGNDQGVAHGVYLAWGLWLTGHPRAAMQQADAAVELAQRLNHPLSLAFSNSYAASIACMQGEFARAEELATRARDIAVTHELALWKAYALMQLGWSRIGHGDLCAGLELARAGMQAWFATGANAGGSLFSAVAAEAHLLLGDIEQARACLSQAETRIERSGERFHQPEVLRLRAELAARGGASFEHVRETLESGLAIARQCGARAWELKLTNTLAARWLERGETVRARQVLATCLAKFAPDEESRDLYFARHLLGMRSTR